MRFFNLSPDIRGDRFISVLETNWKDRGSVIYYAATSKKNPEQAIFSTYKKWAESNFATLYAATNPFDDFAESFANYVHTVVLKKPWQIKIKTTSQDIVITDCWAEVRCARKKALLEELLK